MFIGFQILASSPNWCMIIYTQNLFADDVCISKVLWIWTSTYSTKVYRRDIIY